MSAELFNRKVYLLLGPNGQQGVEITELRVSFKVEKNLEKHPNPAIIHVYNLAPETLGIIQQKNSKVLLQAGYGSLFDVKTVFKGTVARVTTKRSGADIITEIEAGDGEGALATARVNQSFGPGALVSQVLNYVKGAIGLPQGQQSGAVSGQFTHGVSLSGMAKDALTMILNKSNLEWSVQDEELQILPPDAPTSQGSILLTPQTGLISSPYRTKILDTYLAKPQDGRTAQNGIKLIALLNPEFRPGRSIVVRSEQIHTESFRIVKVIFNGDTHSKEWFAEIEAR